MHTYLLGFAIILTVNTPNTLYSFLLPHSKKYLLLLKETADRLAVSLFFCG